MGTATQRTMSKSATKSKRRLVTKKKADTKLKRVGKATIRNALVADLKAQSGRTDIEFAKSSDVANRAKDSVPIEQRAGYPVRRAKGSVDPKNWVTEKGVKVHVDFKRHAWLPDDWGQGVKITIPTAHSTGTSGGTYTVIIAPDGKIFYHRVEAEKYAGYKFSLKLGFNGQVRLAKLQGEQQIQLARMAIKDSQEGNASRLIGTDPDERLFKVLSPTERKHLVAKDKFHFAIVSARRATSVSGIADIFTVQTQLLQAGVTPTWYVDQASLKDYQKLGLKAVVGGKLTAARNKALRDANKAGKVCVQVSDDISAWEYRDGKQAKVREFDAMNKAFAATTRIIASPVAAARFILAKMRGAEGAVKPKLGGVYMLSSCSAAMCGDMFQRQHFIIGDFFVVDVGSTVLFDEEMTLKEDYDFSCAHIKKFGSVLRCNRMTLNVKHYDNAGGACTNRDKKGHEEHRNIAILSRKWPRVFSPNPKRKGEVIMRWKRDDGTMDDADYGGLDTLTKKKRARTA
eukprot:TRINITY_DN102369_c0_g1_i1.p1 TRINITY_DN102369_c0_g1~~TRINITY_DN102369_c0_g1_i1.p1  ORF type:complete len:514 (-),score=59.07 TRINITY_DN102369_c0_g1_i1:42-1583(-)